MSLDFTGKMVGRLTGDIQESDAPYSQTSRDNNEQRGTKLDMYEMYLKNFKNETLFSKIMQGIKENESGVTARHNKKIYKTHNETYSIQYTFVTL